MRREAQKRTAARAYTGAARRVDIAIGPVR
jgi:hypothetical protein